MVNIVETHGILAQTSLKPAAAERVSSMAHELVGSEILKIAGQVRSMIAKGEDILNLTVGDFSSKEFPIPAVLLEGIKNALDDGHTNYPPSVGVLECREAVQAMFKERLGLDYPIDSVLIAGGARPMIAGTYLATVNPGDNVVYPLPSWNNNHYCTMVGAHRVEVLTTAENHFFPRADDFEPHLKTARLICLNTPLNPTGTLMDPAELKGLCEKIVAENGRRAATGRRALYLMFDQVYWMLTHHGAEHATPVALVPEMASYTVFVDGISKAFAATGLRVGWAVGPPDVIERMSAILTHLGAWAPRPEQIATAALLRDDAAIDAYREVMGSEVLGRLDILAKGVSALAAEGIDVDAIPPAGAIYLSMRIGAANKKTPSGQVLKTDEDIRAYILAEAKVALIPFFCFGLKDEGRGWFRASVGAVSKADCEQVVERLGAALRKLN